MTGLVTTDFRVTNAKQYVEMFSESEDNIYFFLGKYSSWVDPGTEAVDDNNPTVPTDTKYELRDVWREMIALKKIISSDVSLGLRRYDWTSGTIYDQFDDRDMSIHYKKWYMVNSQNQVFACLNNGRTLSGGSYTGVQSTYEPFYDGNNPTISVFNTPDGYTWKYIYTISVGSFLKFATPNWIPCVASEDQNNKSSGIYNIILTEFGTGYVDCSVTIDGDGTGATAVPVVVGGQVTRIDITNPGTGYTRATVTISGTSSTPAAARAVCFGRLGIGSRPAYDLGSFFVMNSTSLQYGEGSVIPVYNEYRQFGLMRNPVLSDGVTVASGSIYNMVYRLKVATSDIFNEDEVVSVGGGTGVVIAYETPWPDQYLTLGSVTGTINVGSTITSGVKSATVTTILDQPDLSYGSGDILYLENISPIYRSEAQQETYVLVTEW